MLFCLFVFNKLRHLDVRYRQTIIVSRHLDKRVQLTQSGIYKCQRTFIYRAFSLDHTERLFFILTHTLT